MDRRSKPRHQGLLTAPWNLRLAVDAAHARSSMNPTVLRIVGERDALGCENGTSVATNSATHLPALPSERRGREARTETVRRAQSEEAFDVGDDVPANPVDDVLEHVQDDRIW